MHVGLAHLDIVQAYDWVDLDWMGFGALAHDLAVHLRIRRHIDDEIAADFRLTAKTAAIRQRPPFVHITLFDRIPRRHMIDGRGHAVFGEMAARDFNLTASANAAAAADRIEIDAEPARRLQHAGAFREPLALTGRREYNKMIG